jgi:hypothetical protein
MLREAEVLLSLSDGTLHSPEKAMFNEYQGVAIRGRG